MAHIPGESDPNKIENDYYKNGEPSESDRSTPSMLDSTALPLHDGYGVAFDFGAKITHDDIVKKYLKGHTPNDWSDIEPKGEKWYKNPEPTLADDSETIESRSKEWDALLLEGKKWDISPRPPKKDDSTPIVSPDMGKYSRLLDPIWRRHGFGIAFDLGIDETPRNAYPDWLEEQRLADGDAPTIAGEKWHMDPESTVADQTTNSSAQKGVKPKVQAWLDGAGSQVYGFDDNWGNYIPPIKNYPLTIWPQIFDGILADPELTIKKPIGEKTPDKAVDEAAQTADEPDTTSEQ